MDDGSSADLQLTDGQYSSLREADIVQALNIYFKVESVDMIHKEIILEQAVFHRLDIDGH